MSPSRNSHDFERIFEDWCRNEKCIHLPLTHLSLSRANIDFVVRFIQISGMDNIVLVLILWINIATPHTLHNTFYAVTNAFVLS